MHHTLNSLRQFGLKAKLPPQQIGLFKHLFNKAAEYVEGLEKDAERNAHSLQGQGTERLPGKRRDSVAGKVPGKGKGVRQTAKRDKKGASKPIRNE